MIAELSRWPLCWTPYSHPRHPTRRSIRRHLRHPLHLLPQRNADLFRLARMRALYPGRDDLGVERSGGALDRKAARSSRRG
jgi:hypothetical protein